jgi:outer membrane protein TolC
MNHPKKLLLIILVLLPPLLKAQPLSLDSAYQLARKNYPLIKQRELIKQTSDLTIENLNKGYLPQIAVNGQGTYQSEVTRINIPLPGISVDPLSKDQYKITADVNQLIYDAGTIKEQKSIQQLNAVTEEQKLAVELYKLRERINQLYLGILLTDEQTKQAKLVKADLLNGIAKVQAQVENGTALRSGLNSLKAEALKADQRIIELTSNRESLVNILSVFIGVQLSKDVELVRPVPPSVSSDIARPEIELYTLQQSLIDHQDKLLTAKNRPKASAFVQGGYGRPGLNMLKNEFDWFYITGVRLNWSLSGLYTYKNDKQLININKRTVELQKETFLLNTNSQLVQQQAEINKYEQLIATDQQIIELRKSVKDAALAQLENGVIMSGDYLREVNAEDQARLTLITHQLQLLQAKINFQTITGK